MDDLGWFGCLFFFVMCPWLVGMMIAVVVSWGVYHSVLYAAVHGMLGWLWIAFHYLA